MAEDRDRQRVCRAWPSPNRTAQWRIVFGMSRRRLVPILALFLAACTSTESPSPAATANAPAAGPITLSIVGTNDLHGGILQRDGSRRARAAWRLRRESSRRARPGRRRRPAHRRRRHVPGHARIEPQRRRFRHRRLQHAGLHGRCRRESRVRLRSGGPGAHAAAAGRRSAWRAESACGAGVVSVSRRQPDRHRDRASRWRSGTFGLRPWSPPPACRSASSVS